MVRSQESEAGKESIKGVFLTSFLLCLTGAQFYWWSSEEPYRRHSNCPRPGHLSSGIFSLTDEGHP